MPIDNEGIIHPSNDDKIIQSNEKKLNKINRKMTVIFLTNIIAVIGCIISIYTAHLQKLGYENEIRALELEETKNENILKESKIQIRTSYIVCEMRDVGDVYSYFDDCEIAMYKNDLTELFYNSETHHYCGENDILILDDEDKYNWARSEIIFLRIDIISNRIVKNLSIDCYEIGLEENTNDYLLDFSSYVSFYKEDGRNMSINIGDVAPSEMILIPLALRHSEDNDDGATYKKIYAPQSIRYFDEFYENEFSSEVRDLMDGGFITEFRYYGQG